MTDNIPAVDHPTRTRFAQLGPAQLLSGDPQPQPPPVVSTAVVPSARCTVIPLRPSRAEGNTAGIRDQSTA